MLTVISMEIFAHYIFPNENERSSRMDNMQIIIQAMAILSLISSNAFFF